MVKYHPDARFLTDYTAGSLPQSQALCVSTHLHYCPTCRGKVRELTELGTVLFVQHKNSTVSTTVSDADFDRVLARLADQPVSQPEPVSQPQVVSILPHAIEKLTRGNIDNLKWRKVGKGFRYSPLNLGDPGRETTLLQIRAGGNVPHHKHAGDEITVILKGSFSDNEDKYAVGDFIVRTAGEAHRPVASQDQDCLCLATLDAPIVMTNWLYRLLMPFMNRTSASYAA